MNNHYNILIFEKERSEPHCIRATGDNDRMIQLINDITKKMDIIVDYYLLEQIAIINGRKIFPENANENVKE